MSPPISKIGPSLPVQLMPPGLPPPAGIEGRTVTRGGRTLGVLEEAFWKLEFYTSKQERLIERSENFITFQVPD